jgi:hypothetical protein
LALRKYKRPTADAPLSPAANAKPVEQAPDAVKPAPLPQQSTAQSSPTPSPTPTPPPPSSDLLSLKAQLEMLRQAQGQRAAQADAEHIKSLASNPIEKQIDAIPDLSLAKKAYLRQRPFALSRPDLLRDAHIATLQLGLPDDSMGYFNFLDTALMHFGDFAFHSSPTEATAEAATPQPIPTPTPAPMPQQSTQPPAPTLDDSYSPHIASAPVLRSEYAGSMPPPEASGRVTLSAEERSIAAATGISEVEYAKNKLKLLQMKKAGLIRY